jgi:hypothetical protein
MANIQQLHNASPQSRNPNTNTPARCARWCLITSDVAPAPDPETISYCLVRTCRRPLVVRACGYSLGIPPSERSPWPLRRALFMAASAAHHGTAGTRDLFRLRKCVVPSPTVCGKTERTYQGETWILDSPEAVCAGQARFEYPATFVLFSITKAVKWGDATLTSVEADAWAATLLGRSRGKYWQIYRVLPACSLYVRLVGGLRYISPSRVPVVMTADRRASDSTPE